MSSSCLNAGVGTATAMSRKARDQLENQPNAFSNEVGAVMDDATSINSAYGGPSATSRIFFIPENADRLQLNLTRPRIITLEGQDPRGHWQSRRLKITDKGRMTLE